jgi:predicted acyltransferase
MDEDRRGRVEALDLLRGLAVAGMILVATPGDWSSAYSQLVHAPWQGATAADMVFPTFLFAVGMAIGFSRPKPSRLALGRIARRVLALLALGLLLNALPSFDLPHLRVPGVLQRIALCYALGAGIWLAAGQGDSRLDRTLAFLLLAAAVLLVAYSLMMALVPVPGFGVGRLDPEGNLAASIDRAIFGIPHLWPYGTAPDGRVVYDPEGLLSTLPATANLLFGMAAALLWRHRGDRAIAPVALAGAAMLLAGLALGQAIPINKRIWTASFALVSGGVSALCLSALALIAPALGRGLDPLRVLGGNAIAAFVLQQLIAAYWGLPLIRGPEGASVSLQHVLFEEAGAVLPDPALASLACALLALALVTALVAPLHRRGIHLRL